MLISVKGLPLSVTERRCVSKPNESCSALGQPRTTPCTLSSRSECVGTACDPCGALVTDSMGLPPPHRFKPHNVTHRRQVPLTPPQLSVKGRAPDPCGLCCCCLLVALTSQQHASASQGRICSDNFTCCHTDIEVANQTFHLIQSQYPYTGSTSPSTDPITPGREATGVPIFKSLVWLDPEKIPTQANTGSSTLEADALTTRPTRRCARLVCCWLETDQC